VVENKNNRIQEYLGITVDYNRDGDLTEKAKKMLTTKGFYKKDHEESPQQTFARASTCYSFGDYEFAQRIYEYSSKGYFTFAFSDGWRAAVSVGEVSRSEAARLRKHSAGFNGYDWMVKDIIELGRIRTLEEKHPAEPLEASE